MELKIVNKDHQRIGNDIREQTKKAWKDDDDDGDDNNDNNEGKGLRLRERQSTVGKMDTSSFSETTK